MQLTIFTADGQDRVNQANEWGLFYLSPVNRKSPRRPNAIFADSMERQRMHTIFREILPLASPSLFDRAVAWMNANPV